MESEVTNATAEDVTTQNACGGETCPAGPRSSEVLGEKRQKKGLKRKRLVKGLYTNS